MEIKYSVLNILEKKKGEYISGEDIAKELGISRNYVWKCVNALKREGHRIESKTNSGYCLLSSIENFNSEKIKELTKENLDIYVFDEGDSSNNVLKDMASQGAKEGTVVILKHQSAGKGRNGRSFISDSESGLYMSILLRPRMPIQECVNLTVIAAVSTLCAIEATSGKECSIKWVNDIYLDGKKVCGILTEAGVNVENSTLDYAIVGIGVNVCTPKGGFDSSIKDIATSIYDEGAPQNYKSILCSKILDEFFSLYHNMPDRSYMRIYREKSNIIGKNVDVIFGEKIISGIVKDIDKDANLVVISGGQEYRFSSGEARIKKNEK